MITIPIRMIKDHKYRMFRSVDNHRKITVIEILENIDPNLYWQTLLVEDDDTKERFTINVRMYAARFVTIHNEPIGDVIFYVCLENDDISVCDFYEVTNRST